MSLHNFLLLHLKSYFQNSSSCFIGVSKHLATIKALGLRPRAFICFSVFGYPDETLALVLEIVLQSSSWDKSTGLNSVLRLRLDVLIKKQKKTNDYNFLRGSRTRRKYSSYITGVPLLCRCAHYPAEIRHYSFFFFFFFLKHTGRSVSCLKGRLPEIPGLILGDDLHLW